MIAIKPVPARRTQTIVALLAFLIFIGPLFLPVPPSQAAVIVLDPGHGGNDSGAGRESRVAEKQFTLLLAQKIAAKLAPLHQVELTRTADIQMEPADRAAVANYLRANLMISLHAAVAPYCGDRTAAVYYHNDERLNIAYGTTSPGTPVEPDADRPDWDRLQIRHQHHSQHLADALKRSLGESDAFDRVTVSGLPLVPLMGADLPAVLVEVGCMHPAAQTDPQALDQALDRYAEAIAGAIETALPGLVQ